MVPKRQKLMSEYINEYRFAQLLAKKFAGDLSSEEEQELEKWEKEHPTAISLHAKIADPVNKRGRDEFINKLDTVSSWHKVEQRIARKNKVRSHKLTWWSSSAAAVILLAITIFLYTSPKEAIQKAFLLQRYKQEVPKQYLSLRTGNSSGFHFRIQTVPLI